MPFKNVPVILLAGGKGTRLKPYTTFVPKPLMPIGDFPIIEVILSQLRGFGARKVYIAVGHMAQLIQAFVGDGSKYGLEIEYSPEDAPLGTAGPIAKLRAQLGKSETFVAMNGDVLTTLNYARALKFHQERNPTATICLNRREVPIDFGVIETDGEGQLVGYQEKPVFTHKVSMGVNIFSKAALDFVPDGQFFNIPDLMLAIKNAGQKVLGFEEPCYWLDIGRVEDYSTACEIFEQRRSEFLPNG